MYAFARIRTDQLLFIVFLGMLFVAPFIEMKDGELITGIALYLVVLFWVLWQRSSSGLDPKRMQGSLTLGPRHFTVFLLFPALLIFSSFTLWLVYAPLSYLAPDFVASLLEELLQNPTLRIIPGDTLHNVLLLVLGVALAAIVEETVFRGILFQRWAYRWGVVPAALLSSALFGLLHADMIGAFLFGLLLCLVYIETRSLWLPMVLHAMNNGAFFLLEALEPKGIDFGWFSEAVTVESMRTDWLYFVVSGLLTLPFILFYMYKRWPDAGALPPYADAEGDRERPLTMPDVRADPEPTEAELMSFAGKNSDRYMRRFRKFNPLGTVGYATTWHWPAFFLGPLWYAHRKRYVAALVASVVTILLPLVSNVVIAATAHYTYYLTARKQIRLTRRELPEAPPVSVEGAEREAARVFRDPEFTEEIRRRGGTSLLAPLSLLIAPIWLIIALTAFGLE